MLNLIAYNPIDEEDSSAPARSVWRRFKSGAEAAPCGVSVRAQPGLDEENAALRASSGGGWGGLRLAGLQVLISDGVVVASSSSLCTTKCGNQLSKPSSHDFCHDQLFLLYGDAKRLQVGEVSNWTGKAHSCEAPRRA